MTDLVSYNFVYFSDRYRLMSTDQTSSGSLTRLREKELILYVTFTVQITFPFGHEQHNTHNRSFPNPRGSRVAGFKSRVAGFEKFAGFQKSRVFKRLHYRNITKNKIYTL